MQDDRDVINAVEAAFGPGAFELIAEMEAADLAALEAASARANTRRQPPPCRRHYRGVSTAVCRASRRRGGEAGCRATRTSAVKTEPSNRRQQREPRRRHPEQQALLLFELADTRFGVSVANVVEIQQVPRITRIMRGPRWLRGLANLRGTIISVVDLRLLLGRVAGSLVRMKAA